MNTPTENLKQLHITDYFLSEIEEIAPEDGAPIQLICFYSPDYTIDLEYNKPLYPDGTGRDLNSPTLTFRFTEDNYQKLPEYITFLMDLTIELLAETTNNDACGWRLDIQTREVPRITLTITVTDDLS